MLPASIEDKIFFLDEYKTYIIINHVASIYSDHAKYFLLLDKVIHVIF